MTLRARRESLVLYFSMFFMGACGLAYEYTFSKVASDLLGNSPRQWAIVIGVMMFSMGMGSDLQKRLSDDALLDKFFAFEILLGVAGAFGPLAMLWTYAVKPEYFALVEYAFIGGIGLLIGLEIPLLTRANARWSPELRVNLAGVLKMDYVGSLAGALAWALVLPKFFDIVEMAYVLGLVTLGTAVIALLLMRHHLRRPRLLLTAAAGGLVLLTVSLQNAPAWTGAAEQHLYRDPVIHSQTTPFQHVVLTKDRRDTLNCYINGHLQFSSADEFIYHENLVHPAMAVARNRDRVLILGGGDGLALREVLKYNDVREVVLCDIDPEMTTLSATHPDLARLNGGSFRDARVRRLDKGAPARGAVQPLAFPNQRRPFGDWEGTGVRVHLFNVDAVRYVGQTEGLFDVVILDFPDPNSPDISRLYSTHLYELVKRRLAPDGILVQQSTSPRHAREAFLCIGRTMEAAGFVAVPYHDNVPSFGEWGWWIATLPPLAGGVPLKDRLVKLGSIPVETAYLTADLVRASLAFGRNDLKTIETAVNTITRDCISGFYLKGWTDR